MTKPVDIPSPPPPNPPPSGGRALRAAIIGCPVGHSLSPLIHNYWIEKYNLTGYYDAREIQPGQLKEGLTALLEEGYTGFNITLPHKQTIMALCDSIDDTALKIGAVNCLTLADGILSGTNTDWFGFTESIVEKTPGFDFTAGPALVLGAGGAARAVIYGLRQRGAAKILVANRTPEKTQQLAADFGVEAILWDDRESAATAAALLVNTTSAGMTGKPPLDFNAQALPQTALVCDIVYSPLVTPLLHKASAHGNMTVEGLGMLIHQARAAFAHWTGILPEATDELCSQLTQRLKT